MRAVAAILLAAAAAPPCAATTADASCDAAQANLGTTVLLGDTCTPSGGTCPSSCTQLFEGVLGDCAGKSYTDQVDQQAKPFEPGVWVAGWATFLDAVCQEPVVNVVLKSSTYEATCGDAGSILSAGSILWCSNETMPCPGICQSAMNSMTSVCQSTDTITSGGSSQPASEALIGVRFFMSPDCVADINTCSFGSGCTFGSAPSGGSTAEGPKPSAASSSIRAVSWSSLALVWLAKLMEG